jgi:hypothetical protein
MAGNAYYQPPNMALHPGPTTNDPNALNAFTTPPTSEATARVTNAFGPLDTAGPAGALAAGQAARENSPYAMMPPVGYPPQQAYAAMGRPGGPAYLPGAQAASTNMAVAYMQHSDSHPAATIPDPSGPQIAQLMALMRDSVYPSQREWAAESMAQYDWHSHPEMAQALLTGAREDPAATVRAACVHCLAKMNVNTAPVINAIQSMRADMDPRVRHEVDAALSILVPGAR